jgi:hypothetical protein
MQSAKAVRFYGGLTVPLFIVAAPLLAFAMSESAAVIKGSVKDERDVPYKECRLELLTTNHERLTYSEISSEFTEAFVLEPKEKLYLLRITCDGSDETFTSEPKLLGDMRKTFLIPVELGAVRLERQRK